MKIFETHAHYDDEAFEEDRDTIIPALYEAGILRIANMAASYRGAKATVELMHKYPYVYGALGIHPEECGEMTDEWLSYVERECRDPKCVAIGEIGLDYYWPEPDREIQKYWFRKQLQLAKEQKLPVVIHSRDAAKDTMDILMEEHAETIGGIIHCYSYSKEMAEEYLKMGFYIGVGGVVTFKNGKKLKEVVEAIPLERIVLETDSPYLAPVPLRGSRNDSRNLQYVAETIAQIKGVSVEEVEQITWKNACKVYGLEE